jgi:hypothetical protein
VRNGLADHWAEMLGPELRQVNEGTENMVRAEVAVEKSQFTQVADELHRPEAQRRD